MAIVTIFGGTFGDDEELARNVAAQLGWSFIGRDLFVAASGRCDVPEAKLNDLVEKEPKWWERWQENLKPYRVALQAAMSEAALVENLVYYGHVGPWLLPGIRHVLRVLLTAPSELRVELVRVRQGLDDKAARRYIDQVEKAHTRRLMALFGTDWRDPGQYGLVLNRAQMSSVAAENTIVAAAKLMDFQATMESRRELENLALSTKVQAQLLTFPRLRNLDINIRASGGELILSGVLPTSVQEMEVRNVVEKIPGVKKVVTDFISIPSSALGAG
jgi:cytidylate kinase